MVTNSRMRLNRERLFPVGIILVAHWIGVWWFANGRDFKMAMSSEHGDDVIPYKG
jgi:hypothetical protein